MTFPPSFRMPFSGKSYVAALLLAADVTTSVFLAHGSTTLLSRRASASGSSAPQSHPQEREAHAPSEIEVMVHFTGLSGEEHQASTSSERTRLFSARDTVATVYEKFQIGPWDKLIVQGTVVCAEKNDSLKDVLVHRDSSLDSGQASTSKSESPNVLHLQCIRWVFEAFPTKAQLQETLQQYVRNEDRKGIEKTYGPIDQWNVSEIRDGDLSWLFNDATLYFFNEDIEHWNTSGIKNMIGTFTNAVHFDKPLAWDTSSVTSMKRMFFGACTFNQPLAFDTGKVTDFSEMFYAARKFNQPLDWNTERAEDMSAMFSLATSFDKPLLFKTTKNVKNFRDMFRAATSFNQELVDWNTENAEWMQWMFAEAKSFNKPLRFETGNVNNMSAMFVDAHSLEAPIIFSHMPEENWSNKEEQMFRGARKFKPDAMLTVRTRG